MIIARREKNPIKMWWGVKFISLTFSVVVALSAGALHIISNENLSNSQKMSFSTIFFMKTNVPWMDALKRQMINCNFLSRQGLKSFRISFGEFYEKAFNAHRIKLQLQMIKIEISKVNK